MVVKKAVKKTVAKKGQSKAQAQAPAPAPAPVKAPVKVTKDSILIKLLSGKESYTIEEVMKKTGFSAASANMYLSQSYLDRKNRPYNLVTETKGKKKAFRYVAK